MSVVRVENKCTITFDDDTWHDGVPEVYTIIDGTYPFVVSNTFTYDDKTTLCSASITHNQASQTSFNVKYVQDGTLKLNVCVSSESNYDFMRVYIDSVEKVKISGVVSFKDYEFDMTAGDHVVLLEYKKDNSQSKNSDAGAVGYIEFNGVELPYDERFLLSDFSGKVYTISNDEITEVVGVTIAFLNLKETYVQYGFTSKPTSEQLLSLTKPVIYRWVDRETSKRKLVVKATPRRQTIKGIADMSHHTIKGITSITSVYSGNVNISYSYDDVTYTDETTMSEFLNIDVNELYNQAINKKIYFKLVIEDVNASLTNFVITYINE